MYDETSVHTSNQSHTTNQSHTCTMKSENIEILKGWQGKPFFEYAELGVVLSEVVTPRADTVSLIDDHSV